MKRPTSPDEEGDGVVAAVVDEAAAVAPAIIAMLAAMKRKPAKTA
jgi:hypothetical protein